MKTYMERAREMYEKYGRMTRDGRVYIGGEYVGRVYADKGYSRDKGLTRKLCIPSIDPVDVVSHWLTR